ncbi:hypothetical protein PRIC1_003235 [Phytophthora ramorum]
MASNGIIVLFVFGMLIQFRKTARNVKDNKPKGFGKRVDVAEYIEKKTQRNESHDTPVMEAPRRQRQERRQREVREQHQPRQVRAVRKVREQQTPSKKQPKQQQAPPQYSMPPRRQYADFDATDEIVEYEDRVLQPKRIIYSERESDLYEFESRRKPCLICGDYVHRDSSCCSEKVARLERY